MAKQDKLAAMKNIVAKAVASPKPAKEAAGEKRKLTTYQGFRLSSHGLIHSDAELKIKLYDRDEVDALFESSKDFEKEFQSKTESRRKPIKGNTIDFRHACMGRSIS